MDKAIEELKLFNTAGRLNQKIKSLQPNEVLMDVVTVQEMRDLMQDYMVTKLINKGRNHEN